MKRKYYEQSALILYLDIMKILNKYPNKQQANNILKTKLGLNDKQIAFIYDLEYNEKIEDFDGLLEIFIKMENLDYQKLNFESDKKLIFNSMISSIGIFFIFTVISLIPLFLSIYDIQDRTEFNVNACRYRIPDDYINWHLCIFIRI